MKIAKAFLLLIPVLGFVACIKKIKTDPPVEDPMKSGITLNGKFYETADAKLVEYGNTYNNKSRRWELTLVDFLSTSKKNNRNKLVIELYDQYSESFHVSNGVYSIEHDSIGTDPKDTLHQPFQIYDVEAHVDAYYDLNDEVIENYGYIFNSDSTPLNGGAFELNKDGAIYNITYTLNFGNDILTGIYTGPIQRK
jgi:hypothetical protein